jgi:hypothetical protein
VYSFGCDERHHSRKVEEVKVGEVKLEVGKFWMECLFLKLPDYLPYWLPTTLTVNTHKDFVNSTRSDEVYL